MESVLRKLTSHLLQHCKRGPRKKRLSGNSCHRAPRHLHSRPPPLHLPYPTKPNHNKAVCYVFRKQTFVYLSVYLQIFVR